MYLIESVYVLRIGQGQYVVVIRVVFFLQSSGSATSVMDKGHVYVRL